MASTMSTTWRDEQVVPNGYGDLRYLVRLARQARNRVVSFDWGFTEQELRRLRVAVHYWGSPTTGRYKAFDARVLAAINEAIGEPNSAHVLKEPSNMLGLDTKVSCVRDANGFRLQGHATFDVVFGYGFPGSEPRPDVVARLGQDVLDMLTRTISSLGWDLEVLRSRDYRPVVAAMYGFTPANVIGPALDQNMEAPREARLNFTGPFVLTEQPGLRCLFSDPIANKIGIYLWTVPIDGLERVTYVGQTRRTFGQRTAEHVRGMLSGEYSVQDPDALLAGEQQLLWNGGGDSTRWPGTLPRFVDRLPLIAEKLALTVRTMRVHFAPLDDDLDLFSQLEGAIGRHFAKHPDQSIWRYWAAGTKLPAAIPGERRVRISVTSEAEIAGLAGEIWC